MKRKRVGNEPSVRQRKVASLLKQRISEFLSEGVVEGLSGFVTVLRVQVSPDLRDATVWISVLNQDPKAALFAIRKSVYQLQGKLYEEATMRIMPKVHFRTDSGSEHAGRIAELLEQVKRENDDRE